MNSENNVDSIQSATSAARSSIDQMDLSVISALSELDQKIQTKLENMNLTTAQTMQVLTIIHDIVRPEITKITAMWNGANLQQQNLLSEVADWKVEIITKLVSMSDTEASHHIEVTNDISNLSYLLGQYSARISQAEYNIDEIKNTYLSDMVRLIDNNLAAIHDIQDIQIVLKHYYDIQMYLLSYRQSKIGWKLWYHLSGRCIIGGDGWVFPPLREFAVCNDVPVILRIKWWFSDRFHSIRTKLAHLFGKEEHTDEHVE